MTEVEFLGHVVCGEGTKMQKAKVDALQDLLPPNVPITPADLKRLVQMSQYYSRYIDGFSHIVHAIHTALAEHARNGSGLHDRIAPLKVRASVEALKAALTSDQVLMRPDFTKPFQLAVDTAVSSGVGSRALAAGRQRRTTARRILQPCLRSRCRGTAMVTDAG